MPQGDRSGPLGEGPKTGRGMGYCAEYDAPGYYRGAGRGRGFFRRSWGQGYGHGYFWRRQRGIQPENIRTDTDTESLKSLIINLRDSLNSILNRFETNASSKDVK
jgi:hypothetical protein